jgi:hypothetical protein
MNPEVIYYNGNSICQRINPNDADQPARYQENRPGGILQNATDYQMALIRASIDSSNIPCFIPKIQSGNSINLTAYSITMSLNLNLSGTITTTRSTQPLIYVCRNKYQNQIPLFAGQDSPYYYIFDIQDFIDMVNTTLQNEYNTLQSNSGITFISKCPKMVLNNNEFQIFYDARGYGGSDSTASGNQKEAFTIYINEDLKNLLRNFNMTYTNGIDGNNWQLIVNNKISNNQSINSILYFVETQS